MVIFDGRVFAIVGYHTSPVIEEQLVTRDDALCLEDVEVGHTSHWSCLREWVGRDPWMFDGWVMLYSRRYIHETHEGKMVAHYDDGPPVFVCPD